MSYLFAVSSTDSKYSRKESKKGRMADAQAHGGDEVCQKDALITVARSVANTFGPAYVPFFKGAEISEMRIFQKDDYGDNHRKIRKESTLKSGFV